MIIKLNYKSASYILSVLFVICIICSYFTPSTTAESIDEVPLPIIMYHHIYNNYKALNDYVISPNELEADFKYLKENGYSAILPRELYKYTRGEFTLPEKPVIISFDDGFESVYHYAYPLALKYGMKFVLAIFGKETDHFSIINDHNVAYSYVTWEEIKELSQSGIAEIANHTYNLHEISQRKGAKKKSNETVEAYTKILTEDIGMLQSLLKQNCNVEPETFVYPYGFSCEESEIILDEMGFKITFTCNEGINILSEKDNSLKLLKRINRPHGISAEALFKKWNIN